jgi:hypothetical protein
MVDNEVMTQLTYTKAELQAALHIKCRGTFAKRLALLEAEGFPKRLPSTNGHKALWSKPAVDQWFKDWGHTTTRHPGEGRDADSMNALRNHLEARYQ